MHRLQVITLTALVFSAGLLTAGDPPTKSVEVVGLHVSKKLPDQDRNLTNSYDHGTGIDLIIRQPGKRILGIDRAASKVTSFKDDKDTDLSKSEGFGGIVDDLGTRTSQDGTRVGVRLRSSVLPAKGAAKLVVKGSIVLKIGTDEKTAEEKNVVLKADKGVKVGPATVKIGMGEVNGEKTVMVSYSERVLKAVVFLDKAGKVLESQSYGGGSSSDGTTTVYDTDYHVKGLANLATVRITYFSKTESLTVPLDLEINLGF